MSMGIDMDLGTHYPRPSFDRMMLRGPLTDRKIAKYAREGWYSNELREFRRERNAKRLAKRQAREAIREGNFIKQDGRLIYSPL